MIEIDFDKIPVWWAVCTNQNCKMAEICLRQQVCKQMPQDIRQWTAVLPHEWKDEDCKYFQKYETVMMAKGLNAIYKNIHQRHTLAAIRSILTAQIGSKGAYHRYKTGERLINPAMQQQIINIVHHYAPEAEVEFDQLFETFDFTTS